jgi:hypothetical protein
MIRFVLIFLVLTTAVSAQDIRARQDEVNIDLSIAKAQQSASASFTRNWHVGRNKKIIIGTGLRTTAFLAHDVYYVTAPAELTSGSKGPQVFFKSNILANMDSLLVRRPSLFFINTQIDLGYQFNDKLSVVFNIDVFGLTFGKGVDGTYINGAQTSDAQAKPTTFNLLLVSDNDRGSLNSQLFAKYSLNEKWSLKGGFGFLFTEYTTATEVQQSPSPNDRFRKKSLMFMLGTVIRI